MSGCSCALRVAQVNAAPSKAVNICFSMMFLLTKFVAAKRVGCKRHLAFDCSLSFGKFSRRFWLAVRDLAIWQSPLALSSKWHGKEFAKRQFVFLAICRNPDRNGILRQVSAQCTMQLVPPAKHRTPVRIGLALHDGMMNPVHARRD